MHSSCPYAQCTFTVNLRSIEKACFVAIYAPSLLASGLQRSHVALPVKFDINIVVIKEGDNLCMLHRLLLDQLYEVRVT